jgi:hypothetical protein
LKKNVWTKGLAYIADEIDSSNWESDMFSNLVGDFSDSKLYQLLVEQIYYGKDPLDSEEWTEELIKISKTFSK